MIIVNNHDCDKRNFIHFVVFIGLPQLMKGNGSSKRIDVLNNLHCSFRYNLFPFCRRFMHLVLLFFFYSLRIFLLTNFEIGVCLKGSSRLSPSCCFKNSCVLYFSSSLDRYLLTESGYSYFS